MTTRDCDICALPYTIFKRKPIQCEYCEFEACSKCTETYLLSIKNPGCMSLGCKGIWSRKFIVNSFTYSFIEKQWKPHISNTLFDEQLSLLPDTQLIIEEDNRKTKINDIIQHKKQIGIKIRGLLGAHMKAVEDKHDLPALKAEYRKLDMDEYKARIVLQNMSRITTSELEAYTKEKQFYDHIIVERNKHYYQRQRQGYKVRKELKTHTEILELQAKLNLLHTDIENLKQERDGNVVVARTKTCFVRKCSDNNCRGYLKSNWICGLCDLRTCSECHELNTDGDDHICNPDNVATAKLLSKDTKNCPKCQTGIYKIDGCNQMWCTQCHTAFSWLTGQIEAKIHNPHYYEWMRNNRGLPREPGDVQCGNELTHYVALNIRDALDFHPDTSDLQLVKLYIYDLVRNTIHLQNYYGTNHDLTNTETLYLRKKFLNKVIDTHAFQNSLYRIHKKNSKKTDEWNVFNLLLDTVKDIIFRFQNNIDTNEHDNCDFAILDEVDVIVKYVNSCFNEISTTYKSTVKYAIQNDLSLVTFTTL